MKSSILDPLPETAIAQLSQGADRVIETSCAVIILKGDKAYKAKKSVDFGFLDFTTPEKRREALEREFILNRETASDIYQSVTEVEGEAVLVMRRFDTDAVLEEMSQQNPDWTPDRTLSQQLGQMAAKFHSKTLVCTDAFHTGNTAYVIGSNADHIRHFRAELGTMADAYIEAADKAYSTLKDRVTARLNSGHIRRCHGDMHLGNILLEDGKPILFDCIEFNERLSQIDILYDLAFLLMDLWVRGHAEAANAVFNSWLEAMVRYEGESAYASLDLLPLYLSMRAAVRCHVNAHNGNLSQARIYLKAAHDFLEGTPTQLIAIGGLSGSGKSTRARDIAPHTGRAPGAVILRSDEIRKRLNDCDSLKPLPQTAYTEAATVLTYAAMSDHARQCLRAGHSVIMDATFRAPEQREQAEKVGQTTGATFKGLWLKVSANTRAARIALRKGDVSDATPDIALSQGDIDLASDTWEVEVCSPDQLM